MDELKFLCFSHIDTTVCSMLDNMSPKISPGKSNDANKRKNFRLQAVQEILTSGNKIIEIKGTFGSLANEYDTCRT